MSRITMNDIKNKMTNTHLDLFSTEETRKAMKENEKNEYIKIVPIAKLKTFKNHPFQVLDDERMEEMKESIKNNGILTPILVREIPDSDGYEIISGHRRKRASELIGLEVVPVVIRAISDEESIITMVDSNIQRETLLFSEKAFAYRMKLEALQNKKTVGGQVVHLENEKDNSSTEMMTSDDGQPVHKKTRDILAENNPDSGRQIQRYIRLTYLIPALLTLVDVKKISFNAGVELSYLKENEQEMVHKTILELGVYPSMTQATSLKQYAKESTQPLTLKRVMEFFKAQAPKGKTISFNCKKIEKFFPENSSAEEMTSVIIELLKQWHSDGQAETNQSISIEK